MQRFQAKPELFDQYHEGFRTQVKSWPVNPVDVIYKWIISQERNGKKCNDVSRNGKKIVVADFGCGAEAKLARRLLSRNESKSGKKGKVLCPFKVHSFDLVANGNDLITPCDMAHVPLKDESVDIAVFVLALMGTNIPDFIREAHRVLAPDGILKIAEVRSRFETANDIESNSLGLAKTSTSKEGAKEIKNKEQKNKSGSLLDEFLVVMSELGFSCTKRDRNNKMFFVLEFAKNGSKPSRNVTFSAKPCIYKRR